MQIEYESNSQQAETTYNNLLSETQIAHSEGEMLEEGDSFHNLVCPIPRYKCKRLKNKPPSMSLNDEIMIGVTAKKMLKLAQESGLLQGNKHDVLTMATNSSCEEKRAIGEPFIDQEELYQEAELEAPAFDVKISPVRRKKMLEIIQNFNEQREKTTLNFVEKFFNDSSTPQNLSIELRLMLGRSKAVNRMASDGLDRMDELFMAIEKTTAKINGEEF